MDYLKAREYLDGVAVKGSVYGTETMRILLNEFGNPQDKLKCIHVAGTNGKGSVIAFLDSILRAQGYKVGRYISPSVLEYREKIQINGEYIKEEDVARLITGIREVTERVREATVFEIETVMAFLYFWQNKCDYVILETGLGGTDDATNIIKKPVLSVITSISSDHKNILGGTIAAIASHKAGIIKKGCPAVVLRQKNRSAAKVFKDRCRAVSSELSVADYELAVIRKKDIDGIVFDYKDFKGVEISLAGKYQIKNAVLALQTVLELRKAGVCICDKAVYEGMKNAEWPARFSCLDDGAPPLFADGAHNEDAARLLKETVLEYFSDKKLIFIMGVLADKDYRKIIKIMSGMAEFIVTLTPENKRALDAKLLKEAILGVNGSTGKTAVVTLTVTAAQSVEDAVKRAYEYADAHVPDDYVIIAFGSLSYMGELYRVMHGFKKGRISCNDRP